MVLPGHSGPADGYGRPILRDSDIYFLASQGSNTGLYRWSPQNGFSLLVDNQTFYKEIEGNFLGFGEYIVVPEGFIFEAGFSGGIGLFLLGGEGQLSPIVVPGDQTIQGETIRQAGFIRGNTSFFTFHGSLVGSPPFVESAFLRTPDGRIQRILTDGESIDGQPVFASLSSARGYEAAVLVDHGGSLATTIYRLSLDLHGPLAEVPTLSGAVLAALAAALAVTGLGLLRRT